MDSPSYAGVSRLQHVCRADSLTSIREAGGRTSTLYSPHLYGKTVFSAASHELVHSHARAPLESLSSFGPVATTEFLPIGAVAMSPEASANRVLRGWEASAGTCRRSPIPAALSLRGPGDR